jgi:hypothetical protein
MHASLEPQKPRSSISLSFLFDNHGAEVGPSDDSAIDSRTSAVAPHASANLSHQAFSGTINALGIGHRGHRGHRVSRA